MLNRQSLIALVLFQSLVGLSLGQEIDIQKVELNEAGVSIDHSSNPNSYYLLQHLNIETGTEGPYRDIQLGRNGSGRLTDSGAPLERRFYRIHSFTQENPGDIDQDGIDDLYELADPTLDPLSTSDSDDPIMLDGQMTTQLNAYLNNYEIGRGMFDVTGTAADGSMMGYADGDQVSSGIHDRQWARAFIARDRKSPYRRVAYVVVDNGQVFQSIYQGVFDKIRADDELKDHYSFENIVLSATHTHGAAGGHSHFALFHVSIGGYNWRTYDALVHGIYMAIKNAHRDLKPGSITRNRGNLTNANENRRPNAFLENVEHDNPVLGNPFGNDNRDTEMTLLRFKHEGVTDPVAMFNWFPVHGVSVSKLNTLLTGDNKGNAAHLFEKNQGAIYPGFDDFDSDSSTFVAGFANSNPGDLTANRRNEETPWPEPSANQNSYDGFFDEADDYGRAELIGGRQLDKATALFEGSEGSLAKVSGAIDYRHMYVDMNDVTVDPTQLYPYNVPGVSFPGTTDSDFWRTCQGALGVEFAKGTLDGTALSQFWANVLIGIGGDSQNNCQAPKEVLLTTASTGPGGLAPHWLPISILRVGDFVILSVPGEFTVMAGHRLRKTVENAFAAEGQRVRAVLSGLSNSYAGYVTTYEEYVFEETIEGTLNQGYEAASTHFGAFTLAAYQTKFLEMATAMAQNIDPPDDPSTVSMPSEARSEEIDPTPADKLAVLDVAPIADATAATFHEAAGCPAGQFHIVGTEDCWSCPANFEKALIVTTAADACEIDAFSTFSAGTQHGDPGCPDGQFWIVGTNNCWKCPTGFQKAAVVLSSTNACVKPAIEQFLSALVQDLSPKCPSGYVANDPDSIGSLPERCYKCPSGTTNADILRSWTSSSKCRKDSRRSADVQNISPECPSGYVANDPDLIGALPKRCYKCPTDYDKLILLTWNDSGACRKLTPAESANAENQGVGALFCPTGQSYDTATGNCWSCPSGNKTILSAWSSPNACETVTPRQTAAATPNGKFACELRDPSWFLDLGLNQCWSCPEGSIRNLEPVFSNEACTRLLRTFGDPRTDPQESYRGGDRVEVSFWAGHPKNVFGTFSDDMTNGIDTFFKVQKQNGEDWKTVRTDADWDTLFRWTPQGLSGAATFVWNIPSSITSGTYRVTHEGFRSVLGGVERYEGTSETFEVE